MLSGRFLLKLGAIVLGIVVTGVPMLAFNGWLRSQGEDEAGVTAAWIASSADRQIGQAVTLLQDLVARDAAGCKPHQTAALRSAVLSVGAIKEIAVTAPDGQILCSDVAGPAGRRLALPLSAPAASGGVTLDALRLTDLGERYLRIGVPAGRDQTLAALVPVSALLPHATFHGGRLIAYARITLPDGTLIGGSGVAADADVGPASQRAVATSAVYGLQVSTAMLRGNMITNYDDLRRVGMVVSGLVALCLLGSAILFGWRERGGLDDIARAIQADEFVPYYHPLVDIQTGRLLGAEVLVRWRKPDGTLVLPGAFIPLLESSGLILELTRSLMRRVNTDMAAAFDARPDLSIAFNVAPQHFLDGLILQDIGTIFDGSRLRLSQVVLELTERYEVSDLAGTRRVIAALQGLGCKVAIDDVGAGHSGLSYILKLGVDIIKIDKIFVEAIATETHSRAIIETMIDLARNMKMELIAEGVETFEQVSYLRDHGIRAAQGFVFAPPLPGPAFLELINALAPLTADCDPVRPADKAKAIRPPAAARSAA